MTPAAGIRRAGGAAELTVVTEAARAAGALERHLDGRRMRTDGELFDEFARALDFPDYFGRNWNALFDCLTDLSWLPAPGYLLVVEHAEHLLEHEVPAVRDLFTDLVTQAVQSWAEPVARGEWWDRPAVDLLVVLLTS